MGFDGIVVQSRDLAVVLPAEGPVYWLRPDGAVGRRQGEVMFWVVRSRRQEGIQTEFASDEVYALDRAILSLAEIVRHHR